MNLKTNYIPNFVRNCKSSVIRVYEIQNNGGSLMQQVPPKDLYYATDEFEDGIEYPKLDRLFPACYGIQTPASCMNYIAIDVDNLKTDRFMGKDIQNRILKRIGYNFKNIKLKYSIVITSVDTFYKIFNYHLYIDIINYMDNTFLYAKLREDKFKTLGICEGYIAGINASGIVVTRVSKKFIVPSSININTTIVLLEEGTIHNNDIQIQRSFRKSIYNLIDKGQYGKNSKSNRIVTLRRG